MKRRIALCVLAGAGLLQPVVSFSQAYPAKPIRVIIPNEPGTLDFYVRMMGPKLQEIMGQPWVIEYRSGAGGQIGAKAVASAAPDGYTILFTHPGTHVTVKYLAKNVLYDPVADFTPITALATSWLCLLAHPAFPPNSISELIEHVRRSPGKVAYGSNGVGNTTHLSGEQLKILAGIDMVHVPYKGGAPALAAAVSGQIPLTIVSIAGGALPNLRAGKLKILAMIGAQRYPGLPNVPTMTELVPGFEYPPTHIGFFGPAGLPKAIADRLQGAMVRALKDAELREKVEATGVWVVLNTPEEFATMIKNGISVVGRLVKAAGIQPE